ncbi:hypothetical protein A4X06_0g9296 [Tilletia controversa]|uniref:Uncharacterized protein n=1 Tax=Tilletia controversa TaxID=13291 RepID=A0A8X7MIJ5_9BASI|nr:hypothetical protein CF328_g9356 [Tilletia controversa]KAE8237231.1 hypothetical protein A4X06_0g9296 [Tilletia controversa]
MQSRKSLGKVSYPSKSQAPTGASAADSKKQAPQEKEEEDGELRFVCGGGGSTGCTEESTYGLQEHETCGRRVYASRAHPDDFLPFIADGDVVTGAKEQVGPISESKGPEAHFEGYCSA